MIKSLFFSLVALLVSALSLAQVNADSLATAKEDSLRDQQLEETNKMLVQADSLAISDSIEAKALQEKIASIKNKNAAEKAKLQKQLDSLEAAKEFRKKKLKEQVQALKSETLGVPVEFHGDTLYFVYSKLGPFTPANRAANVQSKLQALCDEDSFSADLLRVEAGEESHDVKHGSQTLLTVTLRDAFFEDTSTDKLANKIKDQIADKVTAYQKEHSFFTMVMRFVWLAVVIIVLLILIRVLRKGWEWGTNKLLARIRPKLNGISFKNYEFLSAERIEGIILWVLGVLRLLFILLVIYLALPTIFSIFPETEGIARQLFGYVLTPVKSFFSALIGYIPELITIAVIIFITRQIVRLLKFLAMEIAAEKLVIPGFYPDWARPTLNLVKVIVYAFAFIIIFPYLPGSDSPVFQGVSVFFGVLISLGSSSAISNMVSGLVITYMRPFKKGDRVRIGDTVGDVIEKTMLVTRLRTIKNEDVTIPNSSVLTGNTINYTSSSQQLGLILHATITIGYDVPWRQVHELLIEAALNTELIEHEPVPFVLQTSLDDFYVSYQINAYTKTPNKGAKIYSDLYANIQDSFNRAGVEIMSPHYEAERDGSTPAVPPEYRQKPEA